MERLFNNNNILKILKRAQPSEKKPEKLRCYPEKLNAGNYREIRLSNNSNPQQWWKGCLHSFLKGDLSCQINDRMYSFVIIEYDKLKRLKHIEIQTIVTVPEISLIDLAGSEEDFTKKCDYIRLDFALDCIGEIYKDNQPHIHFNKNDAVRFPVDFFSNNIIVDYYDMLYRNYFYGNWIAWLKNLEDVKKIPNIEIIFKKFNDYGCSIDDIDNCCKIETCNLLDMEGLLSKLSGIILEKKNLLSNQYGNIKIPEIAKFLYK
jgi:hypothetical protein